MEGYYETKFIIKENLFFDNLTPNSAVMVNARVMPITLACLNHYIQNYGSDAIPSQKSLINIFKYFPPGNGGGVIGFFSMTEKDFFVSINDSFIRNFAYKTGIFYY